MTDQPALHSLDFRLSYGECDPAGIVTTPPTTRGSNGW